MPADALRATLPRFDSPEASHAFARLGEWLQRYGMAPLLAASEAYWCGTFESGDDQLVAYGWRPTDPVGTVVIIHGYYDHVGLYGRLALHLLRQGWAVVAFDLPGHGLSSGPRASTDSFQHYTRGFATLLEQLEGRFPAPWCGVGQSTGGAILIDHLLHAEAPILERACALAPLVAPAGWHWRGWLRYQTGRWLHRAVPRGFSCNSHDEDFLALVRNDPLQSRELPLAWVGAMAGWMRRVRRAPESPYPLLLIQGLADETVEWRYNLPLLQRKFPHARRVDLPRARHHLVNECDELRLQVFAAMDSELQQALR